MDLIFHRTSVRTFQKKPVEDEKIKRLLEAAMASPSACNQQAWRFYVVTDKEMLQKIAKVSPYAGPAAAAAGAIVIFYTEDVQAPEFGQIDCAIASENIWLEADALGLGGVLLGIAPVQERMKALEDTLNVPEGYRAFGIFAFGYPAKQQDQVNRYDPSKVTVIR
jgi:nitroreductase